MCRNNFSEEYFSWNHVSNVLVQTILKLNSMHSLFTGKNPLLIFFYHFFFYLCFYLFIFFNLLPPLFCTSLIAQLLQNSSCKNNLKFICFEEVAYLYLLDHVFFHRCTSVIYLKKKHKRNKNSVIENMNFVMQARNSICVF